jgi:hypothetical protein
MIPGLWTRGGSYGLFHVANLANAVGAINEHPQPRSVGEPDLLNRNILLRLWHCVLMSDHEH